MEFEKFYLELLRTLSLGLEVRIRLDKDLNALEVLTVHFPHNSVQAPAYGSYRVFTRDIEQSKLGQAAHFGKVLEASRIGCLEVIGLRKE